jgi:hypothetical protein
MPCVVNAGFSKRDREPVILAHLARQATQIRRGHSTRPYAAHPESRHSLHIAAIAHCTQACDH